MDFGLYFKLGKKSSSKPTGFYFKFEIDFCRLLISGCWFLVSELWFLVADLWFLVSGFWFEVSELWFLVSGFELLRLGEPLGGTRGNPGRRAADTGL